MAPSKSQSPQTHPQQEKSAGHRASSTIRRELRGILSRLNLKQSSQLLRRISVKPKMRFDALDRLSITAPDYIFKQHYGFEGIKKNGVAMSMRPYDHFGKLFTQTKALDTLADTIAELRAERITSKITF